MKNPKKQLDRGEQNGRAATYVKHQGTDSKAHKDQAVLRGAKKLAGSLLTDGQLLPAKEIVSQLPVIEWFPGGSAAERTTARIRSIALIYAVRALFKTAPKMKRELEALLRKKQCLVPGKADALIRAMVPLPNHAGKRQSSVYSEIATVVTLLERHHVDPNRVAAIIKKKGYTLTDLIGMQRKHKRSIDRKPKTASPGQRRKRAHRSLKSVFDDHRLQPSDHVIAELEWRKSGWHVVNEMVLGSMSDEDTYWKRLTAALKQPPEAK